MLLLAALLGGCAPWGGSEPAMSTEVVARRHTPLPERGDDAAWDDAPVFRAPLLPQDMVEPRLAVPSTREVRVRALSDGTRIAFRLEWLDPTDDDLPGSGLFADACAVQLPATTTPDLPAPQMGEPGRPVEITYWRATWQASVDGRPDTITALHPGAAVDHYPFDAPSLEPGSPAQRAMADRYAPARAVGNPVAVARVQPVEDLIGEGPSTLRPAPESRSRGAGTRTRDGWAVVLSRPLPALTPQGRGQVAFAVWDGTHKEVGARKMRTVWLPLRVEDAP